MKKTYHWLSSIQDCLLPPTCLLCGHEGDNRRDICQPCYGLLPWHTTGCVRCGAALEADLGTDCLCGLCLSAPPAFATTQAPFIYQGAVRHLITSLKFNATYPNARLLGQLLAEHVSHTVALPELIIPVPLNLARYRQRGFNQAIEIAKTVAQELNLPLDLACCRRPQDTAPQTSLSARQRQQNMKGAFAVVKPLRAHHVAILDDVMTTGSTVHALALALKKAGVERVDVWVCARA